MTLHNSILAKILKRLTSPGQYEILMGDLEELYVIRREEKGKAFAYFSFVRDCLSCLRKNALARETEIKFPKSKSTFMFGNYFKISLRNIKSNPGYSLINILGLSLGITCCLLLFHYVKNDFVYDKFHSKGDRIFRITLSTNEDGSPSNANGSYGTGASMMRDFPEVENFTRFAKFDQDSKVLVVKDEKKFYETNVFFADSSVFDVFDFPLQAGDPATALVNPNTVVLTAEAASKYFGEEDPMGKILRADPSNTGNLIDLMVTGVLKPIPHESHIRIGFLTSMVTQKRNLETWYGFQQVFNYILLKPNTDWRALNAKLSDYPEKYMGEDAFYGVSLQPLFEIHLNSDLRSEIQPNSSWERVYIFSGIAVLILMIACINYFTLATARSSKRAREVGVRKALGAQRKELVFQFLSEAFIMALVAAVTGVLLAHLFLPTFNTFTGRQLEILSLSQIGDTLLFLISLVLVISIISGLYPAVFLSSFLPVKVLKANVSSRKSLVGLRKGLVIFQFCVAVILIINTLIINQQMQLVKEKSLTENGEQILVMPVNNEIRARYETFKQEVKQVPGVLNAGGTSLVPSLGSTTECYTLDRLDGYTCAFTYWVDKDYIPTMGYELLAGSNFGDNISDTLKAIVVSRLLSNEYDSINPHNSIGEKFGTNYFEGGYIKGVIEDFHVNSLRRPKGNTILVLSDPSDFYFVAVRLNPVMVSQAISGLQKVWAETSTLFPFDYFFLEESFRALHENDQKTGETMTIFAMLAIAIGCIGLLGLVSYSVEQKSKEVGVRKVLGASGLSVFVLFVKEYTGLIVISMVLGLPVAYYSMNKWLQEFAFRVDLSPAVFAAGGLITVFLVFFAVSFQSWKASNISPVKSLKDE